MYQSVWLGGIFSADGFLSVWRRCENDWVSVLVIERLSALKWCLSLAQIQVFKIVSVNHSYTECVSVLLPVDPKYFGNKISLNFAEHKMYLDYQLHYYITNILILCKLHTVSFAAKTWSTTVSLLSPHSTNLHAGTFPSALSGSNLLCLSMNVFGRLGSPYWAPTPLKYT